MSKVIKQGTLGVYVGGFKELKGLQGRVTEDTPESDGYVWLDFGNKRLHRLDIKRVDWTDIGKLEVEPIKARKEELVEVETSE